MFRPYTSSDQTKCVDTYSRAFAADPSVDAYFANSQNKANALRTLCLLQLSGAEEVVLAEDGLGIAMWNSPDYKESQSLKKIILMLKLLRSIGLRNLFPALTSMAATQNARPKEPHVYLLNMCVDPSLQGRGIGSKLLAEGLKKCDQAGVPCYLEIANPANQTFYEHFGFKVTQQISELPGIPPVKGMWREPV